VRWAMFFTTWTRCERDGGTKNPDWRFDAGAGNNIAYAQTSSVDGVRVGNAS